jgi:general secretion pathway protein G
MDQITYKRNKASRRGFTLLEILLVVGLLALLAAFVVPALTTQSDRAKIKLAEAAIGPNGPLSQAVNLFKVNTGVYPEELKYLLEKPSDDDIAKKWAGPYIENESGLKDPWENEYQYNANGQHNEGKYDLWSNGPDGREGTEDDVVNWKTDR